MSGRKTRCDSKAWRLDLLTMLQTWQCWAERGWNKTCSRTICRGESRQQTRQSCSRRSRTGSWHRTRGHGWSVQCSKSRCCLRWPWCLPQQSWLIPLWCAAPSSSWLLLRPCGSWPSHRTLPWSPIHLRQSWCTFPSRSFLPRALADPFEVDKMQMFYSRWSGTPAAAALVYHAATQQQRQTLNCKKTFHRPVWCSWSHYRCP